MVMQITSSQSAGSKTFMSVRYLSDLKDFFSNFFKHPTFGILHNVEHEKPGKTLIASQLRDFQMKLYEFCIQSNSKLSIATNLKIFSSNFSSFVYSETRKL